MGDPFSAWTTAARASVAAAVAGTPSPHVPDASPALSTSSAAASLAATAARDAAADALAPAVSAAWAGVVAAVKAGDDADAALAVASALTRLAACTRRASRAVSASLHFTDPPTAAAAAKAVRRDAAAAFAAGGDAGDLEAALTRFYGDALARVSDAAGADAEFEEAGEDGDGADHDHEDYENDGPFDSQNMDVDATPALSTRPPTTPRRLDVPSLLGPAAAATLADVAAASAHLGVAGAADAAVAAAAASAVRARADRAAARGFARRALPSVRRWAAAVPSAVLAASTQGRGRKGAPRAAAAAASRWRALLDACAHEAVGDARAAQLFDIVVDWPDSKPAIDDVAAAVAAAPPSLAVRVGAVFGAATRARLLHAGAATGDVIAQYVATVRALASVDPGGLLLARVGGPVRAHLRARSDTVRCVVGALAGGDEGAAALPGLLDDLEGDAGAASAAAAAAAAAPESDGDDGDDAARVRAALAVAPPPRPRRRRDLANPNAVTTSSATEPSTSSPAAADAVGLLVSIFGGADVLASEYRALLATRLLSTPRGYDADAHVRTLELLRARFGDAGLHGAEVMLKDVADSRRARAAVAALPPGAAPASPPRGGGGGDAPTTTIADGTTLGGAGGVGRLSALITSAVFWPPLPGGGGRGAHTTPSSSSRPPFKLPAPVHAWMESYAARYFVLKAPRRLVWAPAAGVATLTVRVGGKARTFTATPLEASVLCAVAEGGSDRDWSVSDVAAAVESTDNDAARALARWVGAGVLVDRGGGAYGRATVLPARGAGGGVAVPPGGGDEEEGGGG